MPETKPELSQYQQAELERAKAIIREYLTRHGIATKFGLLEQLSLHRIDITVRGFAILWMLNHSQLDPCFNDTGGDTDDADYDPDISEDPLELSDEVCFVLPDAS